MKGYWFKTKNQTFQKSFSPKNKQTTRNKQKNKSTSAKKSRQASMSQTSTKVIPSNKNIPKFNNDQAFQKILKNPGKKSQSNILTGTTASDHILTNLNSFLQKILKISQKLLAMQQFYTVSIEAQQYGHVASRCFHHKSEIIMYCHNDHTCLCAECMYGNQASKISPLYKMPRSSVSKDQSLNNQTRNHPLPSHSHHKVEQISSSLSEIENDNRYWAQTMRQEQNKLSYRLKQWKKLLSFCSQSKSKYLLSVQDQYTRLCKQLSTHYLKSKVAIEQLHSHIQQKIENIISQMLNIKKLIDPRRFVHPVIQHLWFKQNQHTSENNKNKGYFGLAAEDNIITDIRQYVKLKAQRLCKITA